MANLDITSLWESLRDAGLLEVMLYLPDGSACRCHWDDTTVLGGTRVALLGDQDRNIVRIIPVDTCIGIGVPSPKGVDPVGYRSVIRERLEPQVDPTNWDETIEPTASWNARSSFGSR